MRRKVIHAAGFVIAVLAVLTAGYATSVPGPFSIDEVTYLLSARSLTLGYGIEVWNGYEEFPTIALAPAWLKPISGRLVSQYPDFYLLFAYPAYLLLGLRGLMLVNVVAFLVVCGLVWSLTAPRFGTRVAWVALALLTFATFAWEYAVGAWPHMVSAAFVLAPLVLVDRLLDLPAVGRRISMSLAAGLVAGIGVGVRLDVVFALAALAAGLMLQRRSLWREAIALFAGAVPPLVALALLNRAKFGLATPFTYGPSFGIAVGIAPYLPVAAGIGAGSFLLWLATRPAIAARLKPEPVGAALAVTLAVAFALPTSRTAIVAGVRGFGEMVVETRLRPIETTETAWPRGADGSVIYFDSLKKSLLQSCPWLPLIALPLLAARRDRRALDRFVLWIAVPLAFVVPYSVFAWDAGLCLNQRYLVPGLPILAVLGALGLDALRASLGTKRWWTLSGVGAAFVTGLAASEVSPFTTEAQSALLLSLPLAVASLLGATLVGMRYLRRAAPGTTALATALIVGFAIGMATFSCLFYDLRRTLELRGIYAPFAETVAAQVGGDALLISDPPEVFAAAITAGSRYRLATNDGQSDETIAALVRFYVERGRPVLIGIHPEDIARLIGSGSFSGLNVARLPSSRGVLVRVTEASTPADPRRTGPGP
ncbi:MAG: N-formylglutamate amidohydrolase [Hyphomicrobiaceae bacterium]|nr:MAG: N-formylglutamate amidohydrolase [Hyphomicrobiaceae bacterium]MBZ0144386.1 hypothetical protein [Rhodocyclaceae bacterium]